MDASTHNNSDFDIGGHIAADRAFHAAVTELAGNKILKAILTSLDDKFRAFLNRTVSTDTPARAWRAHEQHTSIFDAIRDGNADEAEHRMVAHIRWSRDHAKKGVLRPPEQ